jgi:hypothetical protein
VRKRTHSSCTWGLTAIPCTPAAMECYKSGLGPEAALLPLPPLLHSSCAVNPLHPQVLHLWIQPTSVSKIFRIELSVY